uniref:EPS8 signaling adaptor L3b n=1 Tax=Myripristis murdjan TaxID=586833 RepID=A0A667WGZ7_9TELE
RGFSQDDFLQQRRGFQQDDFKSSPLQRSNTFRPNGKSIYMQRKEYSDTLNKQADNFHHRVEHLFTCELDGQEVRNLDDCVAKLKRLDAKGRLWAQEMIMEVQGGHLQLSDIETKADLESLPLSCILETKAVLDSCAYNSLLTITVQDRKKRLPQVFMFQCEELGNFSKKTPERHNVLICLCCYSKQLTFFFLITAAPLINLPPWEEYVSCLQKIKYGFNLLVCTMVPLYPADLPPSVLAPLLTEPAVLLLSNGGLSDSVIWPDDNIPPYIPDFYDGWQLPPIPARPRHQNGPISRSNSQHFPPGGPHGQMNENQNYSPREIESKVYMRVIYDFMARNSQELSIMKGDVVQVLKKNKQWWLIRNNREEEGHVPQNVLEPMDRAESETQNAPPLSMMSTPADVKAWLEYKGFSKITVRSLGVLNGKLLLGMTRDEMRTVCPEEGSKVFFQLQAIKSAIALASESAYGPYNNRY